MALFFFHDLFWLLFLALKHLTMPLAKVAALITPGPITHFQKSNFTDEENHNFLCEYVA
jgi:hypothetical protein